jgi:hypothetical protein
MAVHCSTTRCTVLSLAFCINITLVRDTSTLLFTI